MADKKIFQIQINGIQESIEAVAALNHQLDSLDKRIGELSKKTVSVQVAPTTVVSEKTSSNVSSLSEEAAIQKEIVALQNEGTKLEAKSVAYQDETYQKVMAQRDILKEVVSDQQSLAAAERLQADAYSNTIEGMKAKLTDLKTSISTTDLGDSDKLREMSAEANELSNKIKEAEQAYSQFGKGAADTANATNEFRGLAFTIGGVTQEFDNAKQALKTLQGELRTLQVKKDQGMILSDEEVKRFNELPSVVARLRSSIQDAGKPMDNLMDTMQSFVALAQVSKGASAFFGIDNDKIQESIQKLVALQNVMQGMQALQKQIQSSEFLGGWLSKGNEAIDNLASKLTGAATAQQTLTNSTNAGATASKAMAAAEGTQAVATKATTVATKGLSLALKSIGIGLVISAVAALITYWDDIKKAFTDTVPALKNLSTWFNKIKAVLVGVGNSILNYFVQPIATAGKLIKAVIEGNFKDIPKIITDGFKKTFNVVGNFQKGYNKEIERQQEAHNDNMRKQRMKANEEAEKDAQAKYGNDTKRTKKYLNDQLKLVKKGSDEEKALKRKLWETERKEKEDANKKKLAADKKNAKDETKVEEELSRAKIEAMKDGLTKTITQLEEERRMKLSKLNANAKNYKELELQINKAYDRKIEEARAEHVKNVVELEKNMFNQLTAQRIDYNNRLVQNIKQEQEISKIKEEQSGAELFKMSTLSYGVQGTDRFTPKAQISAGFVGNIKDEMVDDYKEYVNLLRDVETAENEFFVKQIKNEEDLAREYKYVVDSENSMNEELKKLESARTSMSKEEYESKKGILEKTHAAVVSYYNAYKEASDNYLEEERAKVDEVSDIFNEYDTQLKEKYNSIEDIEAAHYISQSLLDEGYTDSFVRTFQQRLSASEAYNTMMLHNAKVYADKLAQAEMAGLNEQKDAELKALKEKYDSDMALQEKFLQDKGELIELDYKKGRLIEEEYQAQSKKLFDDYNRTVNESESTYSEQKNQIIQKYANEEIQITNRKNQTIRKANEDFVQHTLSEFRDAQSALSELENKGPISNGFGFTNIKKTNENNQKILEGYDELLNNLRQKKNEITALFINGLIGKNAAESSIREIDSMTNHIAGKITEIKEELSGWNAVQTIMRESQAYIQGLGDILDGVLSAMWNAEDAEFDKQRENLEKQTDMAEAYYDKMDEAAKNHADNMKSLESDIAQAQGDARDRLIQRYNAEKEAQKEALKEKKKAEKEKQKLDKQQEKLDIEQRKKEKERDLIQAAINTAMAISSAAVNHWPVPAIPMMAMAAAVGATQIAAIQAKSYGNGGLLEGPSHAEGGIQVGRSNVFVEGNEYVIRKKSTAPNLEVLEYINKSEKRLNLGDFIDFYSGKSGNVKKVVTSTMPHNTFADGGTLPTFTNMSNNDALTLAFERYANKPTVVSVVDIIDKTADVQEVRAMAGL